jgi:hyaluronan synthase
MNEHPPAEISLNIYDTQATPGLFKRVIKCWLSLDYLGKWLVSLALLMVGAYIALHHAEAEEISLFAWVDLEERPFFWLLYFFACLSMAIFIWRVYLVITYRPIPAPRVRKLPKITVVVPAYNEGRFVRDTLQSVLASDYPARKMQIIAVDDGSKDDTWEWMKLAAAEAGGRVKLLRLPDNKGKRRAIYEGFQRATGQVFVTIDSDSIVETKTLKQLVAPFVRDKLCGAVAGNVRVANKKEGLIPRMLDVSFTYSFDFLRASQSRFKAVFCTPGALSAYRRDAVMPVLQGWLGQRFMGEPATIGEDRAMTNLILKQGYHVLFQRDAVVFTNVPCAYKGLRKMFLRWARSNVRETIAMSRFAFRRFRATPPIGLRIELSWALIRMTFGEITKVSALLLLIANLAELLPAFLAACCFAALVPAGFYLLRHRDSDLLWAFTYTPFSALALSWISLYALFTVKRSGWLTRELPMVPGTMQPVEVSTQLMAQPVDLN